jgi:MFS superfamily sulfate permease-like transporter
VLGRTPATGEWHNVARFPEANEVPGVVVYRWEAPLFFANCSSFRTQVRRAVSSRDVAWVVLQCEAITDIDVTAAQMLEQLDIELNARGVHLAFVGLRTRLQVLLRRYESFDQIDQQHLYASLDAALFAIQEGEDGTNR